MGGGGRFYSVKLCNQIELHLLQTFHNDQNLNNNGNNTDTNSYLKTRQKTYSIKTARKYVLYGKTRVSSKYLKNELRGPLTFIRAVVTEEGSCAPEIFYIDFYIFIFFI